MMEFELFMKVCTAIENTKNTEEILKKLPKAFNRLSKENNFEDMSKVSFHLEQVFMSRKYTEDNGKRLELNINYKN